jgi:hypothetical protein
MREGEDEEGMEEKVEGGGGRGMASRSCCTGREGCWQ